MARQKSAFRTIAEPLAVAVALAFVVRALLRIYTIPSASMVPTLEVGDHIVVTSYLFGEPARGDIVVFRSNSDPNELVVKRVIALPGELVDAQLGRVRIGGHTVAEPYLLQQGSAGAFESQIVPADSLFVMGDNRGQSLDSRHWGALPRARVVGRARLILWSSRTAAGQTAGQSRRIFKWVE